MNTRTVLIVLGLFVLLFVVAVGIGSCRDGRGKLSLDGHRGWAEFVGSLTLSNSDTKLEITDIREGDRHLDSSKIVLASGGRRTFTVVASKNRPQICKLALTLTDGQQVKISWNPHDETQPSFEFSLKATAEQNKQMLTILRDGGTLTIRNHGSQVAGVSFPE